MECDSPWRYDFLGTSSTIVTDRGIARRIFFNNGATPLVTRVVEDNIRELFPCFTYMNEMNCNSKFLTDKYDQVRSTIAEFLQVNMNENQIIFSRTATEGLNLIAHLLQEIVPEARVLTTVMEHMANYLPYVMRMPTDVVPLAADGTLDLNQYEQLLKNGQGKIKLVAVTAASNLTGYVPPVYRMAKIAHQYGAKILVDAVQAVWHFPFSMQGPTRDQDLDFVVFAGHKCYTGLSGAAVIGPKTFFARRAAPMLYGAGMNQYTDLNRVILEDPPALYEAGYPDIVGITSMGTALEYLNCCHLSSIHQYERELRKYLVRKLQEVPHLVIYGPDPLSEEMCENAIPYVSFNIDGIDPKELARILGYYYGIGVAAGVAGADIYTGQLLGLTPNELYDRYLNGISYGTVRISLAMFNTRTEIDCVIRVLNKICLEKKIRTPGLGSYWKL